MHTTIDKIDQMVAGIYAAVKTGGVANWGGYGEDSYCVTYENQKLVISIGMLGKEPDGKVMKFLLDHCGIPDKSYFKTNPILKGVKMKYMEWDGKDQSFILGGN